MSETAEKCENNAIFKQTYTLKLFIAFKMTYYCCFSLGGNQDFQLLKKSFITSTTEQTFFKFLIFGKSRFPPKNFITSTIGWRKSNSELRERHGQVQKNLRLRKPRIRQQHGRKVSTQRALTDLKAHCHDTIFN